MACGRWAYVLGCNTTPPLGRNVFSLSPKHQDEHQDEHHDQHEHTHGHVAVHPSMYIHHGSSRAPTVADRSGTSVSPFQIMHVLSVGVWPTRIILAPAAPCPG
ncbi:hypothetical protein ACJQWK_09359 [Exserohilum turcicum]